LQTLQTTLVSHETASGQGQYGPWTRHTFTDTAGTKFQTYKADIANAAYGLLNQPVTVNFEAKTNNGYTNNDIIGIAHATTPAPAAPVTSAQAPTQPTRVETDDQKSARIARIASLQRVGEHATAGIVNIEGAAQAMHLASIYATFIQTGVAPGAAAPSGGVGDGAETAGTAAIVPASPVATVGAPVTPDDGIPF
jgi:hypothetical protein